MPTRGLGNCFDNFFFLTAVKAKCLTLEQSVLIVFVWGLLKFCSLVESPAPAEAAHHPIPAENDDLSLGPPGSGHTF